MKAKQILRSFVRLTGCQMTGLDRSYMAVGTLIAGALPAATGVLGVELVPIALVLSVVVAAFAVVTIIGALIAPVIL
jgi:hypothetical protein